MLIGCIRCGSNRYKQRAVWSTVLLLSVLGLSFDEECPRLVFHTACFPYVFSLSWSTELGKFILGFELFDVLCYSSQGFVL